MLDVGSHLLVTKAEDRGCLAVEDIKYWLGKFNQIKSTAEGATSTDLSDIAARLAYVMAVTSTGCMFEQDHPRGDRDGKQIPSKERKASDRASTRATCDLKDSNCHKMKTSWNGDHKSSKRGDASFSGRFDTMKSVFDAGRS